MIEADLRAEILADGAVAAIIDDRMFLKAPIHKQTESYITFHRSGSGKNRTMVSEKNRFQIAAFSYDTEELENLCKAIINALEGKRALNGNEYFSNSLINQTDSDSKLDDGFFWSILTFEFKNSI